MGANDLAIGGSKAAEICTIFVFVGDVPRQADEMLGRRAGSTQDADDVLQCLARLCEKVVADELVTLVPADLTGDREKAPFSDDAVSVTARA